MGETPEHRKQMENITLEIGYGWKHGVDTILLLAKVLDERGVGCPFHFHLILPPYILFLWGYTHCMCMYPFTSLCRQDSI